MAVMAAKLHIATKATGLRALPLRATVAMDPLQQLVIRVMDTKALQVTAQVISQFIVVQTLPMMVILTQQHRSRQATANRSRLITLKVMKVTRAMFIKVLLVTVKLSAVT